MVRSEDVSFRFPVPTATLEHISFTANPARPQPSSAPPAAATVSPHPRFYDVTGGRVTIDGIDVEMPQEQLHSLWAMCPRRAFTSGTIEQPEIRRCADHRCGHEERRLPSHRPPSSNIDAKPEGYA